MKPVASVCLGVLSLTFASALTAQTFPERPVQIITPYAAGGGLDILTRTLAQKLAAQWGRQVLVDNKPGAGSTLGTALAAKAPKDGHTLLVASTPLGVAPAVYATLPYDARRDFAPLALVATTPEVLVVSPSLGVASVAELVAKAKAGKQNFGSAGSGTLGHLAADTVNGRLGLGATHIPYTGSNPATIALLGGQIDWMMDPPAAVTPHLRAGKLRALATAPRERAGHAGDAHRMPHHRRGGRHDGLAEVALHRLERRDRRHADTAQEHRLRLRHVHPARESVRPLRGLVVDVLHVLQPPDAHHLDAVRLERALALRRGLGVVGRAERDAL